MPSLDERYAPVEDVVDTELPDAEIALLDLERKAYFSLNPTGGRIWSGLRNGLTLREISDQLQDEFEVSAPQAERSVLALVAELSSQHMIEPAEVERS